MTRGEVLASRQHLCILVRDVTKTLHPHLELPGSTLMTRRNQDLPDSDEDTQSLMSLFPGNRGPVDRRNVLRTIGIGVGGLAMSQAVATAETNDDGVLVEEYRPADNPLSRQRIQKLQQKAAERYREKADTSKPVPFGGPEASDTRHRIISYAVRVFPNGATQYHASVVGEGTPDDKVAQGHKATKGFVNEVRNKRRPDPVTDTETR